MNFTWWVWPVLLLWVLGAFFIALLVGDEIRNASVQAPEYPELRWTCRRKVWAAIRIVFWPVTAVLCGLIDGGRSIYRSLSGWWS